MSIFHALEAYKKVTLRGFFTPLYPWVNHHMWWYSCVHEMPNTLVFVRARNAILGGVGARTKNQFGGTSPRNCQSSQWSGTLAMYWSLKHE